MTEQSMPKLIEIVSIIPMLHVPGWLESASRSEGPTMDEALKPTARGM